MIYGRKSGRFDFFETTKTVSVHFELNGVKRDETLLSYLAISSIKNDGSRPTDV
jgi:hypothetical protein